MRGYRQQSDNRQKQPFRDESEPVGEPTPDNELSEKTPSPETDNGVTDPPIGCIHKESAPNLPPQNHSEHVEETKLTNESTSHDSRNLHYGMDFSYEKNTSPQLTFPPNTATNIAISIESVSRAFRDLTNLQDGPSPTRSKLWKRLSH